MSTCLQRSCAAARVEWAAAGSFLDGPRAPDADGYAIEFQMSIRALQLGLRVLEIPTQEAPRIGRGVSKLNAIPVGLRFFALLVREWARPRVHR